VTAAVVATTADGRTRCTTLRSAPPISLRDTPDGLFLVASGAGPIGGDALTLDVEVGAGAALTVRSAAASMVLPGPHRAPSSLTVQARVAGSLRWTPEPTVLVTGCDHRATTRISLGADASLLWREEVVLGRHDEPGGSLLQRIHVDRVGRPLLRTEVPLGPRWPASDGPAGTAGARAVGSLLVIGCPAAPVSTDASAAVLAIGPDAWLVTAVAAGASELRRLLDAAMPSDIVTNSLQGPHEGR
jgi:urease accessory protein